MTDLEYKMYPKLIVFCYEVYPNYHQSGIIITLLNYYLTRKVPVYALEFYISWKISFIGALLIIFPFSKQFSLVRNILLNIFCSLFTDDRLLKNEKPNGKQRIDWCYHYKRKHWVKVLVDPHRRNKCKQHHWRHHWLAYNHSNHGQKHIRQAVENKCHIWSSFCDRRKLTYKTNWNRKSLNDDAAKCQSKFLASILL